MKIFVVELEPTHYKIDLWNQVSFDLEELFLVYSERKNWLSDGGHNYLKFPKTFFNYSTYRGKGFWGKIYASLMILINLNKYKPELTYIAGYVHFQTLVSIFYCLVFKKKFVVHADIFNNFLPDGSFKHLKFYFRELIRKIIFTHANYIFVCGKRGIETAKIAGCPIEKIKNFPYCVSKERIMSDSPSEIPKNCISDLEADKIIIFFSGRMIERKGLKVLLESLSKLITNKPWIAWIEGDGPELENYRDYTKTLNIEGKCRFLGFCQFDMHSWLIRSSDIVIVPSYKDSWGIVVDEGIQLGKIVISSSAVGSSYDRINNNFNGIIFHSGDSKNLATKITKVLEDEKYSNFLSSNAKASALNITPKDNSNLLCSLIENG